jgi:hypothetical protein
MHSTQNKNDEAEFLAGSPASSSARRAGQTVIQFPFQGPVAAASMALEDAIETEEDSFQSLGSIAIRLVGQWSLPKLTCWRQGEEPAASHHHGFEWEEDRP